MDQAEYLKRYISKDDTKSEPKKVKKRKHKTLKTTNKLNPKICIIDDDASLILAKETLNQTLDEQLDSDKPLVLDFLDERPQSVKQLDYYRKNDKWKLLKNTSDSDQVLSHQVKMSICANDNSNSDSYNISCKDSNAKTKHHRHDSSSDNSLDLSPIRQERSPGDDGNKDFSPRRQRHDSSDDDDLSAPSRKPKSSGSGTEDLSPPRHKHQSSSNSNLSPHVKRKIKSNLKTSKGFIAGLSSSEQLQVELRQLKSKNSRFNIEDDGRSASTIFRDRSSGRKRDLNVESEEKEKLVKKEEKQKEKYQSWSKGLTQKRDFEQAELDAAHEASKPFARGRDDEDLDEMLKDQEREGDPMLDYMKKQKEKSNKNKKLNLPRYSGPDPPPNRFKIWPGYRWDGVDRSNGFEVKIFSKQSEREATKIAAYKWSVENM